ncbi:probable serine/threonine-protein kinase DDB_G0280133 isoform X1 [Drosophila biarmipes]|uniref:probable serine/threonine-protein kinase DDB_G0280133 isoform X1 n=1 Tax=Drosophila biarmipes TaxID=125945 RepID=UPI0007E6244C|nr:probable serine/threonine-protein kinase DDB_G0280133 isoform X1 [Drosophila biarmipes]
MVLRSGIIIPFQFRDTKKLLMIGVPEENRNLNIWDLKNVVRAAFGIYNFEFRNKKIGFNIPDELLLHYLAQRHDLTNFVIEISQVYDVALDNYVLNRQCRCADQKMLNDSPTPEEPTNLCQPSNVLEPAPTPIMTMPPCEEEDHDHEHEHEESMKYRIDKASSGAASAELGMPAYEACSPKMDYDTQDELPDSPHSQPLPPPPLPLPSALPLPPPPTSHHQHLQQQQQQQQHEEEQQHILQERIIQQEYIIQQQQQHQHLQQQHHLALLQQQQEQQQQQQIQQTTNLAMGTTTTNNIRQRKERMSKRQKELYVHFLQQHQFINDHRRNDPVLDPYWLKLANLLNAVPQGAVKHVTEWKQTFDNWRYRIFLYARYNSKLQDEEAQNPRNFKPLTRTDKQAYIMWIRNPDTAPPDLDKMRNVFCNLEETAVQQE